MTTKEFWFPALSFALLFLPCSVLADRGSVVWEGLSAPCADCIQEADSSDCIRVQDGEKLLLSCEELVFEILAELLTSGTYEGKTPSVSELRKALLGGKHSVTRVESLLKLLLSVEAGQRAFKSEVSRYFERYPKLLERLTLEGHGSPETWMSLWVLPEREGIQIPTTLKAVLLLQHPELGLGDLLREFSISDPKKDLLLLRVYRDTFDGRNEEWSVELAEAAKFVEACISKEPETQAACKGGEFSRFSAPMVNYLNRVQIQSILERFRAGDAPSYKVIERIAETNYREYRTPETHELVLEKLREGLLSSDENVRLRLLRPASRELLMFFAENDETLRREFAAFLVKSSSEAWNAGNIDLVLSLLRLSYQVLPTQMMERNIFVDALKKSELRTESGAFSERLRSVIGKSQPEKRASGKTRIKSPLILIGVACFLGVFWGLVFFFRVKQKAKEDEALQRELEKIELQELIQVFGVSRSVSDEELGRTFRLKAKEVHPDAGGGNDEEFASLQQQYERLRELLEKFNAES